MIEKIRALIAQGEGLKVEFKEASTAVPNTVYETVCSFLNTKGGDILLGVKDDKTVAGVSVDHVFALQQNFSTAVNNNQLINPPFCLQLDPYIIDGRTVLHVFVPESSQVHRYKNNIYIRRHDSDLNITNNQEEVRRLYNQKSSSYSENKIFKAVTMDDLREDLFEYVRKVVTIGNADHSWSSMDNKTMLRSMGLFQKDLNSGEEGFTLACILLFGKDDIIRSAVPAFKMDLIKRVENKDRYDDRDIFTTNLIESYTRAMQFIEKHLPSPFYLEKDRRIDLRNIIFREIIANALVHKEYLGAEPTRIVIEEDKIYTENSNKPYINGLITMDNTVSHPKNPTITKVFRELGLVEELGSGFNRLFHYAKIYTGNDPIIEDLPIFRFSLQIPFFSRKARTDLFDIPIIDQVAESDRMAQSATQNQSVSPTSDTASDTVSDTPTDTVRDTVASSIQQLPMDKILDLIGDEGRKVLELCERPLKTTEIMAIMKYSNKSYFLQNILYPLINLGVLEQTHPDIPNHPNQKYQTVKRSRDE